MICQKALKFFNKFYYCIKLSTQNNIKKLLTTLLKKKNIPLKKWISKIFQTLNILQKAYVIVNDYILINDKQSRKNVCKNHKI